MRESIATGRTVSATKTKNISLMEALEERQFLSTTYYVSST